MRKLFSYILILLCCTNILAQRDQSVALVLSGGGAKGLAHIGVLKALEENHVPIDYVCGTSMGAIISGLYASGYSIQEIENIFFSKEFENWVSGRIDKRVSPYYIVPQEDETMFQVGFDVEKKFKASLPLSLVNPVQMDFAFLDIFAGANKVCNGDFNNLMVPFFCIATNVNDNTQSIRRKGDLGRSIRASMSFPFFFAPIQLDGKMMCDGGIYNNFPAQEMLDFYNPDMILGVKVVNNFDEPKDDDLILYIENMVTMDSQYDILCDNGVMLEPNMSDIGVMDFSKKQECINRGYQIAMENLSKIKYLLPDSVSDEDIAKKRKDFNDQKGETIIGNIIIRGVNEHQQKYYEKMLTMNLHNETLTLNKIKSNYLALCSDPNVSNVTPYMYFDHFTKEYVLELNIKMKKSLDLKVGGVLSSDPISNLFLGADFNYVNHLAWRHKANAYVGRYYRSLMYDIRMDVPNPNIPFYLEGSITSNHWNYFRNRNSLFEYSAINYLVQQEENVILKFGLPISRHDKFMAKVGYGYIDDKYFTENIIITNDTTDNTTFSHFAGGMLWERNTLDNSHLPTDGGFSRISAQFISGKERFHAGNSAIPMDEYSHNHTWIQFGIKERLYHSFSDKYSLGLSLDAFYSFQDLFYIRKASLLNAGIFNPTLESMTRFYQEYRANQYIAFGAENIWKIGSSILGNVSLRMKTYLFLPVRQILENDSFQPYYGNFFDKAYGIAAANLVFSTRIGDLTLGASYHQRDNGAMPWNISISIGSMIFNNKNIDR